MKTRKEPDQDLGRNLSIEEVAERLGISKRYVSQLIFDRKLLHVRIGRRCLVPEGALVKFLKDRTVPAFDGVK